MRKGESLVKVLLGVGSLRKSMEKDAREGKKHAKGM